MEYDITVDPGTERFYCNVCQHYIWADEQIPNLRHTFAKTNQAIPDNLVLEAALQHQSIHTIRR